jgi:hypothetical protein
VASVDARLMPTLRRFEERGASSGKPLPELRTLEVQPRELAEPDEGDLPFPALPARGLPVEEAG